MSFENQRAHALAILTNTDVWPRGSYAPLLFKLLWRLGFRIPPPHFANFWLTVVVYGAAYCAISGPLVWFVVSSQGGIAPITAAYASLRTGAVFGLFVAAFFAYGRYKYKLPSWQSLGS
jgi:hypothetical protein